MAEAEDRDLNGTAGAPEEPAAETAPETPAPEAPAEEAPPAEAPAAEGSDEPVAEGTGEPLAEGTGEPGAEGTGEPAPEGTEAPADTAPEPAGEAAEGTEESPAEPVEEPVRGLAELAADARYSATGKRKSSVARVILRPGTGRFELNGRDLETYFPRLAHRAIVMQPLEATGITGRVDVRARIHGGGVSGQADALRHGISKALIEAEPSLRGELKRRQFLTRDPRVKERKKAGLKKARKRPQFSKR
jgi:small subunit ribosomal protein S9